ncbi:hypothetical protein [Paenibacillus humicola]|uniref:hypothetical protein n=1 Tax=Paenibacillus humicola TaxID=3110540 RepID=UPI00237BCA96|nr:hypothetical protein [Paenibacillus humicola]
MRTFVSRCSLALVVRDAFTGLAPSPSSVTVRVAGTSRKPVVKREGIWVFSDLAPGAAVVRIESPIYAAKTLRIDPSTLNPLNPIKAVSLMPGRAYPLPSGATALDLTFSDAEGRRASGAAVSAVMTDDRAARARIAADAPAGAAVLEALSVAGRPAPGDCYLIRTREGEILDRCRLAGMGPEDRRIRLDEPLAAAISKGSLLLPVMEADADANGFVRLVFRPAVQTPEFTISLEAESGGRLRLKETLRLLEGRINVAGPLVLH